MTRTSSQNHQMQLEEMNNLPLKQRFGSLFYQLGKYDQNRLAAIKLALSHGWGLTPKEQAWLLKLMERVGL